MKGIDDKEATIGVEVGDEKNLQIYQHFGFVHYVKQGRETYPDGTEIDVRYYAKIFYKRTKCNKKCCCSPNIK